MRQTGTVDKLPSGRWRARVWDTAHGRRRSLGTYRTKSDADAAIRRASVAQDDGTWVNPDRGKVTVVAYVADWIATNPRIGSPRTRERYEGLLRNHIAPRIGAAALNKVTPTDIRQLHTALTAEASPSTAAKVYRLLRSVYTTGVADELVVRNPCKIDGGGVERSPERPIATVAEVQALAEVASDRWKALVLTAAWTGLRFGELAALTRADVNLLKRTVTVSKNRQRLDDGTTVVLPPKSAASRRTVALPAPLVDVLTDHLGRYTAPGPEAVVFVGEKGAPLDRSHWNREWRQIRADAGLPHLRFHDLRHTGNMLAAATGATTKQLMSRMGHSSMQAALRYQHATADADQAIAEALGELMTPRGEVVDLDQRREA